MKTLKERIESLEEALHAHPVYKRVTFTLSMPLGREDLKVEVCLRGYYSWGESNIKDIVNQIADVKAKDADLDRYCPGWEQSLINRLSKQIDIFERKTRRETDLHTKSIVKKNRANAFVAKQKAAKKKALEDRSSEAKEAMKELCGV